MTRLTPRWVATSVRNKLLAMALLPLLVAFPLLVLALAMWGNVAYDRLLITKVRSDLAVAHGYFDQVLTEVGAGAQGVANSQALFAALQQPDAAGSDLQAQLTDARERLGLDFLVLYSPQGLALARSAPTGVDAPAPAQRPRMPRELQQTLQDDGSPSKALLMVMGPDALEALAPHLLPRVQLPVVPTRNAAPSDRTREDRAMVVVSTLPVRDATGRTLALLTGGLLLNQNLDFIDHINRIVYPDGSLPFGSQGTATLFLDDVRITTNVRLFQDQRAIGTRVSQTVRDSVLGQGNTWLDRAFVVNDWYVSAYKPLLDANAQRVGMLYVGYLEAPFRQMRYAALAVIGLIFLLVMALSAWFSVRWARSIFQPVERMNRTMQRVEEGQPNARVGALPVRDELGALAAHLDQLLDVIDDKTRTLQRWGEELDHKVAERTRELEMSNASLQLAQQQLVKSEKLAAIGQLTASIAHEINNPIAVMQGNLDLIRETLGNHSQPVHGELRLLDEQVERMRLIVTQLLQYARPTEYAGYVETLDLNRTVDDCLVLVAHLLAQTRIEVQRHLQATRRVGFNRQELQQVIINLLINAIQAMPTGGVLRLETRNCVLSAGDTPKPGAQLCVVDSGPGLTPDVQERLFRPFFTTKNDGNGLGLWISMGLLERYGGHMEATNRIDGTGAAFTVQLLTEPQAPAAVNTRDGRPGSDVNAPQ
ncbi:MAG: cache domain-containing protein [Hydrogenophaga sp.]|uniref:sensor histidine kinase n=1 Tax=Hydrogenophaga sp. TaxID=1904254 RepID=UPI0027198B11|nr:cache domain-containing protein [Hydrogenophaga sp.]MDO9149358.1 cache domain-containing protein [Hydrogenophaga sp.]MDO9603032.1 cache domain-containing protein [Hydrogenophaga sp.]